METAVSGGVDLYYDKPNTVTAVLFVTVVTFPNKTENPTGKMSSDHGGVRNADFQGDYEMKAGMF